jgi:hypothetical protein
VEGDIHDPLVAVPFHQAKDYAVLYFFDMREGLQLTAGKIVAVEVFNQLSV